ncbi:MAG: acylneuraminate cytidylyltransferase family protein [Candidatus Omnitrophica bacterium]|nr:acylneuraminate cytidylyltransferase family protein [Candidatus Omnitrophota bacterium]
MPEPKVLLTIAARGGSKGVKNKNIRQLAGKPLIAHTIDQARRWGRAARIVCSTDSPEIAEAARAYGADVPFTRPADLAGDASGKIDVLRHAWESCERIYQERYEMLLDLDATAPIRRIEDIEGAYRMFIDRRPDTVVSVVSAHKSPYFNMLEQKPDGFVSLCKVPARPILRRQDAPVVFDMNASIYVYARDFLLNPAVRTAVEGRTLAWLMDKVSAFDIDTEEDFIFVDYLITKGLVTL